MRAAMVQVGADLAAKGLSPVRSGNLSVRLGADGACLITPSGFGLSELEEGALVPLDGAGEPAAGARKPSSEWPMHTAIYRARAEVEAIVHVHSPHAVAVSVTGEAIPPFHYMIAVIGGRDIPCAPYAGFGSDELGAFAADALKDRKACLLANHGLVATGPTIDEAARIAEEVETLARQYILARQAGPVRLLSDDEIVDALQRFSGYGQRG